MAQAKLAVVTPAQLRAARAYLDWTMEQAATASDLHRRTIIRLEKNGTYGDGQASSLQKLVACYQLHGITFDGNGLRLIGQEAQELQLTGG